MCATCVQILGVLMNDKKSKSTDNFLSNTGSYVKIVNIYCPVAQFEIRGKLAIWGSFEHGAQGTPYIGEIWRPFELFFVGALRKIIWY